MFFYGKKKRFIEEFLRKNSDLVKKAVHDALKMNGTSLEELGLEFEDLYNEAIFGIYDAINSYNEKRSKFTTWLYHKIIGRVTTLIRKELAYKKRNVVMNPIKDKDGEEKFDFINNTACELDTEENAIAKQTLKELKEKLEREEYEVIKTETKYVKMNRRIAYKHVIRNL